MEVWRRNLPRQPLPPARSRPPLPAIRPSCPRAVSPTRIDSAPIRASAAIRPRRAAEPAPPRRAHAAASALLRAASQSTRRRIRAPAPPPRDVPATASDRCAVARRKGRSRGTSPGGITSSSHKLRRPDDGRGSAECRAIERGGRKHW